MNTRSAITGIMLASVLLLPVTAETAPIKILPTEDNLRFFAKHDNNLDTVQQLLAEGVDPNGVDWHGQAAVHVAAEHDAAKNMEALLQAGGNPNLQDQDGNTPLHHAARGTIASFDSLTVILLRAGADPNRPNNGGETPLHVAVGPHGAHTEVEALLAGGASVTAVTDEGLTPLQRFVREGSNNGYVIDLLLDAGANPDEKDPGGDAPLHVAVRNAPYTGKSDTVDALLAGGADPCVRNAEGYIPYHLSYEKEWTHQALGHAEGHDLACDDQPKETEEDVDYATALAKLEERKAEQRRIEREQREAEQRRVEQEQHEAEQRRVEREQREAEQRRVTAELARREAEEREWQEIERERREVEREWREMERRKENQRAEYWREFTQGMNQIIEQAAQQRQNQESSGGQGSSWSGCANGCYIK